MKRTKKPSPKWDFENFQLNPELFRAALEEWRENGWKQAPSKALQFWRSLNAEVAA
jgi:hypothetical protein